MGYVCTDIACTQSDYEVEPGLSPVDSKTKATLIGP